MSSHGLISPAEQKRNELHLYMPANCKGATSSVTKKSNNIHSLGTRKTTNKKTENSMIEKKSYKYVIWVHICTALHSEQLDSIL